MTAALGTVQIGPWVFPGVFGNGVAVINWVSSAKIDEKESDGQHDARTTFKGRMPGKVEITLSWAEKVGKNRALIDEYAVRMLADISPRGPNAGKPWELVAQDQEIHNAHNIEVKDLKGPVRTPGKGEATATLTCSTWAKQKPSTVTKTPEKAEPWGTKPAPEVTTLVPDPPGFLNAQTAPVVTP